MFLVKEWCNVIVRKLRSYLGAFLQLFLWWMHWKMDFFFGQKNHRAKSVLHGEIEIISC